MNPSELVSRLNYVLGRFEGIAFAINSDLVNEYMFDTCELLSAIIEDIDTEVKPEL